MSHYRRALLLLLLSCSGVGGRLAAQIPQPLPAVQPPAGAGLPRLQLQGPAFFVVTRGMAVADILRDFGANYTVPMMVSEQVTDRFIGTLRHSDPKQLLRQLSKLYNLVWYYDGAALYVYKAHEFATTLITPKYLSAEQLQRSLQQADVLSPHNCRLKVVKEFNAFELFGVPACIRRVTTLVKELDSQAHQEAQSRETVTIFPLRYASASDMVYHYREQQVIVPGVVSVLKTMSSAQGMATDEAEGVVNSNGGNNKSTTVQFSADPRQNAVVIRDREISMPIYRRLIEQLDRPQIPIEVSLVIIDVNAGQLDQLGLEWPTQLGGRLVGGHLKHLPPPAGGTDYFSAVISNVNDFMVRVNLLQQNSKAKVLSQPSIVTLNNVQAVLDKSVTFYTKLVGEKASKLAAITSGTLLRVTPRLLTDPASGEEGVLLQLNIQDGRQQASNSSQEPLPQVQSAEIATQASLKLGQSLLLGGFMQDSMATTEHRVPMLGEIPLLGRLFRNTHQEIQSVVRLFLIKAVPVNRDPVAHDLSYLGKRAVATGRRIEKTVGRG